jgi:cystathionine beta-lyase family protein involved in aluminum resistance
MRPPVAAYLQGGLTYTQVVLALEKILGALEETPAL